jgi:hypothetical protein
MILIRWERTDTTSPALVQLVKMFIKSKYSQMCSLPLSSGTDHNMSFMHIRETHQTNYLGCQSIWNLILISNRFYPLKKIPDSSNVWLTCLKLNLATVCSANCRTLVRNALRSADSKLNVLFRHTWQDQAMFHVRLLMFYLLHRWDKLKKKRTFCPELSSKIMKVTRQTKRCISG